LNCDIHNTLSGASEGSIVSRSKQKDIVLVVLETINKFFIRLRFFCAQKKEAKKRLEAFKAIVVSKT